TVALEQRIGALPQKARVLEVGSGGGQLARTIASWRPDITLVGVDLSPEQVARARQRTTAFGDRIRFVEGNALDLPFGAGECDAVIGVASVKHGPDPARGLSECARVLRFGGLSAIGEVDRSCRLEDARAFVGGWNAPRPLKPIALLLFRTFVAGQSL